MTTQSFRCATQLTGRVALFLTIVLGVACTSTHGSLPASKAGGEWLEPTPRLRLQIEDEAKRLPWTHGIERVELIQWFAKVGEPAYPTLLAMVLDPRKDVAGAALAALGATRDSRLVEHLRELPWPEGEGNNDLALERSRTLLRLGDWSMLPKLIAGLRDERLVTRALCAQALYESTNERFDFDPRAEEAAREESVKKWEAWWAQRDGDPLRPAQP